MQSIEDAREAFDGVLAHVKQDIATIRTGRANPAMVEDIPVEAYGSRQPMKNVATISTPDSRTIMISPWDKSLLSVIDKSIQTVNLGLNPTSDGTVIRLNIPSLTEETRRELVKMLGQRLEAGRIRLRQEREDARMKASAAEKEGQISEDEKFHFSEKLDALVKDYNERIETMGKEKEAEIMKV